MPFALVFVGLILVVSGVRDTQAALGKQVAADFTGDGNFTYWIASLGAVGALGYIPAFKGLSIAFMTLIIVAILVKSNSSGSGFFGEFYAAIKAGPTAPAATTSTTATTSTSGASQ